jgi:hypothetical protein
MAKSASAQGDSAQLWRICAVFFGFSPCSLQSITQKSIEHRIGCNCGAFAPYFLDFSLAPLVEDGAPQAMFKNVKFMHVMLNSPGL